MMMMMIGRLTTHRAGHTTNRCLWDGVAKLECITPEDVDIHGCNSFEVPALCSSAAAANRLDNNRLRLPTARGLITVANAIHLQNPSSAVILLGDKAFEVIDSQCWLLCNDVEREHVYR